MDEEAEATIRRHLTENFPDWGYLGEETGSWGPSGAPYRWLVDPNDGTRSYLRGLRGTAISIALVSEGLPVLGVVYAPTAPDDDGDLFTWAEGCPLVRNGRELNKRTLPVRLGPLDVVLVSQDADRNPPANAACAAPARFRAAPSIAYRAADGGGVRPDADPDGVDASHAGEPRTPTRIATRSCLTELVGANTRDRLARSVLDEPDLSSWERRGARQSRARLGHLRCCSARAVQATRRRPSDTRWLGLYCGTKPSPHSCYQTARDRSRRQAGTTIVSKKPAALRLRVP